MPDAGDVEGVVDGTCGLLGAPAVRHREVSRRNCAGAWWPTSVFSHTVLSA